MARCAIPRSFESQCRRTYASSACIAHTSRCSLSQPAPLPPAPSRAPTSCSRTWRSSRPPRGPESAPEVSAAVGVCSCGTPASFAACCLPTPYCGSLLMTRLEVSVTTDYVCQLAQTVYSLLCVCSLPPPQPRRTCAIATRNLWTSRKRSLLSLYSAQLLCIHNSFLPHRQLKSLAF